MENEITFTPMFMKSYDITTKPEDLQFLGKSGFIAHVPVDCKRTEKTIPDSTSVYTSQR